MADDRIALLETLRKATADGDVDVLREGVRVLAQAIMEVEGEHGRKRRRNPSDQLIESEVEPIVPEPLRKRVQAALVTRRANRLPPDRYKGAYVLGTSPIRRRIVAVERPQSGEASAALAAFRALLGRIPELVPGTRSVARDE